MPNRPDLTKDEWAVTVIPALLGGLNTQDLPHLIDETQTPNVFGLRNDSGRLVQDSGFSYLDSNTGTSGHATLFGIPIGMFEFNRLSGTSEALLITTKTMYKLSGSVWQLVSMGVNSTLSLGEIGLSTVWNVVSYANFVAGSYIAVFLADGTLHMDTIVSFAVPNKINVLSGIPMGKIANVGSTVYQAPLYTANENNHITGVVLPSADSFVFTNEVDYPQMYDGSSVVRIPGTSAINLDACTTLCLWKGYLLLGGTKESSTWRHWRIRRSDIENFSEWINGDAGYDDLADAKDDIQAMRPLGDYNVIYRVRSIIRQEYVGSIAQLFRYRSITHGSVFESTGIGIVSPSAVVVAIDKHYFTSSDGVYTYGGGYYVERVSAKIDDMYFSRDGIIAETDLSRIRMGYDEENHLILVSIRSGAAPTAFDDRILMLDTIGGGWFVRTLSFCMNTLGIYRTGDSTPWGSLVGSWASQRWVWGGAITSSRTPRITVGAKVIEDANWRTASYGLATDDFGVPIFWSLDTRDLDAFDKLVRISYVEFVLSGVAIDLSYSTDRGITFKHLYTLNPIGDNDRMRVYHEATVNVIRYRLSSNGGGGSVSDMTLKMKEASRW